MISFLSDSSLFKKNSDKIILLEYWPEVLIFQGDVNDIINRSLRF